jgi:hypothetical protein
MRSCLADSDHDGSAEPGIAQRARRRHPAPISPPGISTFDDLASEQAEQVGAIRAGEHVRQVDKRAARSVTIFGVRSGF